MIKCINDYSIEIDSIHKEIWAELLCEFDDASIRQTWSIGSIIYGESNLSHLVLKRGNEIVGMAQVIIRQFPFIKAGIAQVFWGPLWRKKGRSLDYAIFGKMIEALKSEYVTRRRLLLHIWPFGFEDTEEWMISTLHNFGLIRKSIDQPYRTLLLDISPPLEELRNNLSQKWRNQLNIAEKNKLEIIEGCSDEMYLMFLTILREMVSRKKFKTRIDYDLYRLIQNDLPPNLKMKIFICTFEGKPIAGGVFSAIGETGQYMFGATANNGLKANGSNLIQWTMLKWLKGSGCKWYDSGGIDPSGNPGVYRFKLGIVGKRGKDVSHLGQFVLADNPINYLLNMCIDSIKYSQSILYGGMQLYLKIVHFCFRSTKYTA